MTARVDADELRRLALVGSAIAARPVAVAEAADGEATWTDGVVIHLDRRLAPTDRVPAVAVQAALLAAGSLGPEVAGGLDRRGRVGARYLAVEGHRALAAIEDLLPPAVRTLIDHPTATRSTAPAESLAIARGREDVAVAPDLFGTIRPRHLRDAPSAAADDSVRQAAPPTTRERWRELDDDEDAVADEGGRGFDLTNPIGGGGAVGKLLARVLGTSRSRGTGSPGAEAATHRTRNGGRTSVAAVVSSTRADLPGDVPDELARTQVEWRYPEWNVHARRYRPDWCRVTEIDAGPGTARAARPASRSASGPVVHGDVAGLRRALARLGLDLERRHRQLQGDEVDLDAVVEARVAVAAGAAPDEAVWVDSVRGRRELSVLVLLDLSGSANEPSRTGVGTVHDQQLAAASALTRALHELGDRVALYGFRSQGRAAVQLVPVRRFADPLDARALARLAAAVPAGYTRLGAAIRHGAAVLETEGGTARRLLVVVSDGFAYDHGYEGAYGEADARRALAEARRRGTACLCLSIGAGADAEALRRVFGTAAHAGFGRADQLAASAAPLFRSALRLAEVQRRTSQRRERTRERLLVEGRTG